MNITTVLSARINDYAPGNELEQENVLQELLQHYVLCSLSRTSFFKHAMFHGGTCLRILYGMNRFSEDLDFLLKAPDKTFQWTPYLTAVQRDCKAEGLDFEIVERSQSESAVKKAFLKTDSIGTILEISLPYERSRRKKIRIKMEVDTNPPAGSHFETKYLTFPLPAAITTQALSSGFGTKSHALLCRSYDKGRDWYDFGWYVQRGITPDLGVLTNALRQQGEWAGSTFAVTPEWYTEHMEKRIKALDWNTVRRDVRRFLSMQEQEGLTVWGKEYFLEQLEQVTAMLTKQNR